MTQWVKSRSVMPVPNGTLEYFLLHFQSSSLLHVPGEEAPEGLSTWTPCHLRGRSDRFLVFRSSHHGGHVGVGTNECEICEYACKHFLLTKQIFLKIFVLIIEINYTPDP